MVNLNTSIADMSFRTRPWITAQLDTRIRNGLQRGKIFTLGQLVDITEHELERIDQGLGVISRTAIKAALKDMGLKLKSRKR